MSLNYNCIQLTIAQVMYNCGRIHEGGIPDSHNNGEIEIARF
jgi:hypothetical protein